MSLHSLNSPLMPSQEAQRAIQALNPLERAVFALTRAIIGTKRARSLFILYAASLVSLLHFQHLAKALINSSMS